MFQVSLDGLSDFAASFWKHFGKAKIFAFHGTMGAGKTTIITALCHRKGTKDVISSPTFSIINEYHFKEDGEDRKIYHMDWYRLNSVEEIIQAGAEECIYSDEICFIEWPEKAPELLDEKTLHVSIEPLEGNMRQVKVEAGNASLV